MELFIADHAVGAVQDVILDAVTELTRTISKDQLKPREQVQDTVSHLDSLQFNQGRLAVLQDLLEQIDEQTT